MSKHLSIGIMLALATLVAAPASAQLNGENLLGDTGVKNGSQAAPGTYVAFLYYRYSTDTIRDKNGDVVRGSTLAQLCAHEVERSFVVLSVVGDDHLVVGSEIPTRRDLLRDATDVP